MFAQQIRKFISGRKKRIGLDAVVLLTVIALYLHLVFFRSAGGLWRDEVNSVNLANLGSIREIWNSLEFDSFPIAWFLLLRAWSAVVGHGDLAYRALGFVVGMALLSSAWFAARVFRLRFPVFLFGLVCLSPAVIRWGDSIRAYGIGTAALVTAYALHWRVLQRPTLGWNIVAASLAGTLAAQLLYFNVVFLCAFAVAALTVLVIYKARWQRFASLLLITTLPAISLLPYIAVFQRSAAWRPILQYPELWSGFHPRWYLHNIDLALRESGRTTFWIVSTLVALSFVTAVLCLIGRNRFLSRRYRPGAILSVGILVWAVVGYYVFLHFLQLLTQTWYYLTLFAIVALTIELALSAYSGWLTRPVRMAFVILFGCATFYGARSNVATRMTNIDLLAEWLGRHGEPDDLVLVTPWYCGISFARYYHGAAEWMTIPSINDHRFHRFDLLQAAMSAPDQGVLLSAIFERIKTTLDEGKHVWIVGDITFPSTGTTTPILKPAPQEKSRWHQTPYYQQWSLQVGSVIHEDSGKEGFVNFQIRQRINSFENLPLFLIEKAPGE
jgi:hypothetical protein